MTGTVSQSNGKTASRDKKPANGRRGAEFKALKAAVPARKFSAREVAVRLFVTCWIVFSLHFATNTVREIYPALSLGDHFSFDVSEYENLHPDIFRFEDRGAFINNNPGASMMGSVPYFVLRPVTDRIVARVEKARSENPQRDELKYDSIYPMAREFYQKAREKGFDIKFGLAAAEMQFFVMSPLTALSVVVMFYIFLNLKMKTGTAALFAALYAFATPVFFRAAQLNQNLLVADFALFGFALLWRFGKTKKPFYFLGGLCAGWSVLLDYSGLVVVLALSGYAFWRWFSVANAERNLGDLIKFGTGLSIGILILLWYQWTCFGNPFLPAQSYMPAAHFSELGYRGFALPQPDLLFETAFSMRYGLFTSAPILLFAFAAFLPIKRKSPAFERSELIFAAAFIVLFFLFCASNQYGRMQFNTGVRHIVPVVPFIFLLAAQGLMKVPKFFAAPVAITCLYWSWCLAMYRDVEQGMGVFEALKNITFVGFQLPWLSVLQKMGFIEHASPLPLFLLCGAIIASIWLVGGKRPSNAETEDWEIG